MTEAVLHKIESEHLASKKMLAVLIDPDSQSDEDLIVFLNSIKDSGAHLIFVGGSLMLKDNLDHCLTIIRQYSDLPTVLFPGSVMQVSSKADAILFLSLISGRNPDLLIGSHVLAAPYIKESGLETMATGYMLIDSGRQTTASYISGTSPIPYAKDEIASCTAMAGEMLGLRLIYMDGGSGADKPISASMISMVRKSVNLPLIIGGGIRNKEQAKQAFDAGADIVVIGNAGQKNPQLYSEVVSTIDHS